MDERTRAERSFEDWSNEYEPVPKDHTRFFGCLLSLRAYNDRFYAAESKGLSDFHLNLKHSGHESGGKWFWMGKRHALLQALRFTSSFRVARHELRHLLLVNRHRDKYAMADEHHRSWLIKNPGDASGVPYCRYRGFCIAAHHGIRLFGAHDSGASRALTRVVWDRMMANPNGLGYVDVPNSVIR